MESRFRDHDIDLTLNENVIPDDNTTLFTCSGMQNLKHLFKRKDGTKTGSLQTCIRTDDLDLVGDGSHLTSFSMLGNFSFGRNDYEDSVDLWDSILKDLQFEIDYITYHPDRPNHKVLWEKRGYEVRPDSECVWSDGEIGGYCCEVFSRGIEIGNLVNTEDVSTDVGFGWERLYMIFEGRDRVDQTSLFKQNINPIISDHIRTLEILHKNDVIPGSKGRNSVCRKLLRRFMDLGGPETDSYLFDKWIDSETKILQDKTKLVKKVYNRHKHQDSKFWLETYGVTEEELKSIIRSI